MTKSSKGRAVDGPGVDEPTGVGEKDGDGARVGALASANPPTPIRSNATLRRIGVDGMTRVESKSGDCSGLKSRGTSFDSTSNHDSVAKVARRRFASPVSLVRVQLESLRVASKMENALRRRRGLACQLLGSIPRPPT